MITLGISRFIEGLQVYGDDQRPNVFYVIPDQPRIRVDDQTKKPVFKFIKYKMPVDRADGSKGGGFVIFDCTLTVPDDKLKKIQDTLDQDLQSRGVKGVNGQPLTAELARITFTSGTASLILLDSGGALVSKIESPGKPSLFGSMICPFTAELTPEGATVVEAGLKGSGGIMQVTYDMKFPATFPPITGRVWFNATKAYSFTQSISKSGGSWDSSDNTENESLRESFMNSQAGGVWFDFGSLSYMDADSQKKVHDAIENWGWSQLDEAVKTAILPDIKPTDDRGDDGMKNINKSMSTVETSSFSRTVSERESIDFENAFGGTVPNITDMGFKWQDYFVEIDANDPFFFQIHASIAVNADFDMFGINSVDVNCTYKNTNPKGLHATKPDDVLKYDSDTQNGDMTYTYSYAVNYKDQSKAYESAPLSTKNAQVTINANDLGILCVNISVGNVDFDKTPQVQVAVSYPDKDANGNPISQQFNFTKDNKTARMLAVLLKPVDKKYQYQITYIMADGTQVVMNPVQNDSMQVYVNSPFVMHTYSFLAEGDFAGSIDNIFLKMKYDDPVNKIDQEADFTFTSQNRSKDWAIPIIDNGKGKITYSGVISYKDHTTEEIPPTDTTRDLIEFGPPNQVIISVVPDTTLIDFTQVKLVKLDLEYKDDANKIDMKHEYLLKDGGAMPVPWTFYARDPAKTSYSYTTTFYMAGSPPKVVTVPAATSSDTSLVLMMPS